MKYIGISIIFFKKIVPVQASFSYILVFFLMTQLEIDKSLDGMLGTQTWGGKMEGANKSTEP